MSTIPTLKYCKDATEFNKYTIELRKKGKTSRNYRELLDGIFKGIKDKANKGEESFVKEMHNHPERNEIIKKTFESFGYDVEISEPKDNRVDITFTW